MMVAEVPIVAVQIWVCWLSGEISVLGGGFEADTTGG